MKRTHITAVLAVIVLAGGAQSGAAAATPAEGDVVRTDLAKGTTDAPISIVTQGQPMAFYVQNLLLKPVSSSGWHSHPGPEFSVVTKGAVYLQTATNCLPAAFSAGQAIFIPAGIPHKVMNQGPDDAEAVVTYTLPADLPIRNDIPAACP